MSSSKLRTWSWVLYDGANSAYGSIMVTAYFILYFKSAIVKDIYRGDFIWGKMIGGSMLFLALISPILGAIADEGRLRKKLFIFFSLLSIFATAGLAFFKPTGLFECISLFCLSLIGYEASITFYDSFLSNVSTPSTTGKISGWGFGVGYMGGLLSIALAYPFISQIKNGEWSMAPLWMIVVIQFIVLGLPSFLLNDEEPSVRTYSKPISLTVSDGLKNLFHTIKELKKYPDLFKFLIAYLFFFDGIATAISFGGTFAKDTLGFTTVEVFLVFIVSNLVAVPGALVTGYVSDKLGGKKTILITLVLWIVTLVALMLSHSKIGFYIVSAMVGIGLGSTQGSARALYAQFIPKGEEAKFFALKGLCGKAGTVLGPITFGLVSYLTSNQRHAAGSLIIFFVIGFILVYLVNEQKGKQAVQVTS